MAKRRLTIGCVLVVVGGNGLGACGGSIGVTDGMTQDSETDGSGGFVGAMVTGGTGGDVFIGVPSDGFVGDIGGGGGFVGVIYPGTGGIGTVGTGGEPNFGGMGGDDPVDED